MRDPSAEEDAKRIVGIAAVDAYVRTDTCIGLGTGTTTYYSVRRVGELVAQGLRVRAVATSLETERLCREAGIALATLGDEPIDVAIDGADEAAPDRSLIKGGGGALFREKAVALAARTFVVIVTARKLVPQLGRFPLPIEVVPFSLLYVKAEIERLGIPSTIRQRAGAAFVTDNGNAILDCACGPIAEPVALDRRLRDVHGVVATGLFTGLASRVLVASADGTTSEY